MPTTLHEVFGPDLQNKLLGTNKKASSRHIPQKYMSDDFVGLP
jgi:hypothetical protein